ICQIFEYLGVTIQSQREATYQVLFCRFQLCLSHPAFHKAVQSISYDLQRLFALFLLGLQPDLEGSLDRHRHKVTVYAIHQSALLPDLCSQARDKSTPTKNVISDIKRKIVRITAPDSGVTKQDMRLSRR